jgi:23S rRNA (uracil1939-C5)-methyltransferase
MQEKKCKFYKKCGGCQLDMPYEDQLEYKMKLEQKLLGKFSKIEPIIGMYYPYHYRMKVQAAFAKDQRTNKIISGVYQSNSHKIVPVESCNIEDKKADEIIQTIKALCKDFKFIPRHVLVKHSPTTNQIMVVIVTQTPILPSKRNFTNALREKHPEITTIIHNINPYDTNLVLGPREEILFGKGFIEDRLLGCTFKISARSFYQINHTQTEKLYTEALSDADLKDKTVLDAYCGTGTIGILAATKGAKEVIGVELEKDAVKDAIQNARQNNIKNIKFYNADATEFITELAENKEAVDVIILDPPRAGSTEAFLDAVAALAPKQIIYISCNPETLARDLDYFLNNKTKNKPTYKITKIRPVDMFPHTTHVETVVHLMKG